MMSKRSFLAVLLAVFSLIGLTHAEVSKAAGSTASELQLASVNAVVYDLSSGQPIYSKNPDVVVPIASVTKLMTAMVVLDARLPLDELITVNSEDKDLLKNTYSRVRMGSKLSRREMLKLALMSSENRAASALGRHYPGGRAAFLRAMNLKARQLGMLSTRFDDTTGLSSGNVSTASDLVKMIAAANQYPLIREYTTATDHIATFRSPRYSLRFGNTNALVRRDRWDIQVSKTGYTREAGRCLVMLANVDNKQVAMVFLDSYGKLTPIGDAGRVRKWMETGKAGSISAEARSYERERNNQRLSTVSGSKNQG